MLTSTRWLSPGPTLAVTMTRVSVCTVFQIHFVGGYWKAGRLNLIAATKWTVERKRRRRGRGIKTWARDAHVIFRGERLSVCVNVDRWHPARDSPICSELISKTPLRAYIASMEDFTGDHCYLLTHLLERSFWLGHRTFEYQRKEIGCPHHSKRNSLLWLDWRWHIPRPRRFCSTRVGSRFHVY